MIHEGDLRCDELTTAEASVTRLTGGRHDPEIVTNCNEGRSLGNKYYFFYNYCQMGIINCKYFTVVKLLLL